ncbi:MAG: hypothetical protein DRP84_06170 [Spirochaetes bacterium]|nr:MAG: hypothetical protein DRP84_06170 [Spirochaetota bacterium]
MRKPTIFMFFALIISLFLVQTLKADNVFLKKINVVGNRITKTSYILEKVTLEPGKTYDIDDLMDQMSIIKSDLLQTGLFENLYFDDQLDNNKNLILTIKVKEKNYLFLGPEGEIYYKKSGNPDISVYLEYVNLLGLNNKIKVSFPIYENRGLFINYRSDNQRKLIFESSVELKKLRSDPVITEDYLTTNFYLIYNGLSNFYNLGSGLTYNRYIDSAFILFPFIEFGSLKKPEDKDSWLYSRELIDIGYGENNDLIYGFSSNICYFKDLFLQIVFKIGVSFDYLDGDVPANLVLSNISRGYPAYYITGNKRISPKVELIIPLQWFPKLTISLFVDSDIIGYNNLRFIVGGGAGIRWFNRYQNPLIVDFAFGNGLEINFSKKI